MRMLTIVVALGLGVMGMGAREMLAQGPPARVYGTVTVDGATPPAGTKVEAYIGGVLCGEGVVRQIGELGLGYVVDVKGEGQQAGCGAAGRDITLKVGGRDAPQTDTFVEGAFIRLDLTVSGAVATPTPGPTPPPFGAGAQTPAAGSPAPSPAPGGSPTAAAGTATPGASASPGTSAGPTGSATPAGSAAASASPGASASPFSVTGSGSSGGSGGGTSPVVWVLLGVLVLAAAGGGYWFLRQRGRGGP